MSKKIKKIKKAKNSHLIELDQYLSKYNLYNY